MKRFALVAAFFAAASGCWDNIEHVYDCEISNNQDGVEDGTDTGSVFSTDSPDTATSDEQPSDGSGQGTRPDDWSLFGAPCETDADCRGEFEGAVCIKDVLGIINTPDGYCAKCCNQAGPDVCAPGVDCVGVDDVYLICLSHCNSDAQCRQDGKWECRPIYVIDDVFPGDFCLPNEENAQSEAGGPVGTPNCDWPWLE